MVHHSTSVAGYQQSSTPSTGQSADATQLTKKSFLKVIDHQNQPATWSAGSGNVSEPTNHSYQPTPAVRQDMASRSRAEDFDYRGPMSSADYRRIHSTDDTHRVVHRNPADLQRYPAAVSDDGYSLRSDVRGRGYPSADDYRRYYSGAGDRREFWDDLSAYCDEFETRVGRRGDVGSQPPQRLPTEYSDVDLRRVAETDRHRGVDDYGRHYPADDIDRRYRPPADDWRGADLRQARYETDPRDSTEPAGRRGRTADYYRGTPADYSSHR